MAAVIAPVTDEEHKELARLVLRAFSSSLFHQRIFGKVDSATHVQFLAVQARSALQDPRCKMVKATRDGKMVGFARWTTPKDADTHAEQKAGNATSIWSQDGHYPPGSEINLAKELLEVPEKELLEPHFREASIPLATPLRLLRSSAYSSQGLICLRLTRECKVLASGRLCCVMSAVKQTTWASLCISGRRPVRATAR
jgi:hypothetical protein